MGGSRTRAYSDPVTNGESIRRGYNTGSTERPASDVGGTSTQLTFRLRLLHRVTVPAGWGRVSVR